VNRESITMKYSIIVGERGTLILRIQEYLADGWELLGSPFITGTKSNYDEVEFAQAIIKRNR
jgi:hypothetical protein